MAYINGSSFEWDEAKSRACLVQRGFDFATASSAFYDPYRILTQDLRHDYGEDRFTAIGAINDRVYVVVYTMRGTVIRIISARKANAREVKHYEHHARQIRSNRP